MKVEKSSFLALPVGRQVRCYFVVPYFFLLRQKSKGRNNLRFSFFGIAPKKKQTPMLRSGLKEGLALERFDYPHLPRC